MLVKNYREYEFDQRFNEAFSKQSDATYLAQQSKSNPYAALFYIILKKDELKPTDEMFARALAVANKPTIVSLVYLLQAYVTANQKKAANLSQELFEQSNGAMTRAVLPAHECESSLVPGLASEVYAKLFLAVNDFDPAQDNSQTFNALFLHMQRAAELGLDYQQMVTDQQTQLDELLAQKSSTLRKKKSKTAFPAAWLMGQDHYVVADKDIDKRKEVNKGFAAYLFGMRLIDNGFYREATYYLMHAAAYVDQQYRADFIQLLSVQQNGFYQQLQAGASWPQFRTGLLTAITRYQRDEKASKKEGRMAALASIIQYVTETDQLTVKPGSTEQCSDADKILYLKFVTHDQKGIDVAKAILEDKDKSMADKQQAIYDALIQQKFGILELAVAITSGVGQYSELTKYIVHQFQVHLAIDNDPACHAVLQRSATCKNEVAEVNKKTHKSTSPLLLKLFPYAVEQGHSRVFSPALNHQAFATANDIKADTDINQLERDLLQFADQINFSPYIHDQIILANFRQIEKTGQLDPKHKIFDLEKLKIETAGEESHPYAITAEDEKKTSKAAIHYAFGMALYAKGRFDDAGRQFAKAIKLGHSLEQLPLTSEIRFDSVKQSWLEFRVSLSEQLQTYTSSKKGVRADVQSGFARLMLERLAKIDDQNGDDASKITQAKEVSSNRTTVKAYIQRAQQLANGKSQETLENFMQALREDASISIIDLALINNSLLGRGSRFVATFKSDEGVSNLTKFVLDVYQQSFLVMSDRTFGSVIVEDQQCFKYMTSFYGNKHLEPMPLVQAALIAEMAKDKHSPKQSTKAIEDLNRLGAADAKNDTETRKATPEAVTVSRLDDAIESIQQTLVALVDQGFDFASYLKEPDTAGLVSELLEKGRLSSNQLVLSLNRMQLSKMGSASFRFQLADTSEAKKASKAAAHLCFALSLLARGLYVSGYEQLFKAAQIDQQLVAQYPVLAALITAEVPNKVVVNKGVDDSVPKQITQACGWLTLRQELLNVLIKYVPSHINATGKLRQEKANAMLTKLSEIDASGVTDGEKVAKVLAELPGLALQLASIGYSAGQTVGTKLGKTEASQVAKDVVRALVWYAGLTSSSLKDIPVDNVVSAARDALVRHAEHKAEQVHEQSRHNKNLLHKAVRPYLAMGHVDDSRTLASGLLSICLEIQKIAQEGKDNSLRIQYVSKADGAISASDLQTLVHSEQTVQRLVLILKGEASRGFDFVKYLRTPHVTLLVTKTLQGTLGDKDTRISFLPTFAGLGQYSSTVPSQDPKNIAAMHYLLAAFLKKNGLVLLADQQLQQAIAQDSTITVFKTLVTDDQRTLPDDLARESQRHRDELLSQPALDIEYRTNDGKKSKTVKPVEMVLKPASRMLELMLSQQFQVFSAKFHASAQAVIIANILYNNMTSAMRAQMAQLMQEDGVFVHNLGNGIVKGLGQQDCATLGVTVKDGQPIINFTQFEKNIGLILVRIQDTLDATQKIQDGKEEDRKDPSIRSHRKVIDKGDEISRNIFPSIHQIADFMLKHEDALCAALEQHKNTDTAAAFKTQILAFVQQLDVTYRQHILPLEQKLATAVERAGNNSDEVLQAIIELFSSPHYKDFYRQCLLTSFAEVTVLTDAVASAFDEVPSDLLQTELQQANKQKGLGADTISGPYGLIRNYFIGLVQKPLKIALFFQDLLLDKDESNQFIGLGMLAKLHPADSAQFQQLQRLYIEYKQMGVAIDKATLDGKKKYGKKEAFDDFSKVYQSFVSQFPDTQRLLSSHPAQLQKVEQSTNTMFDQFKRPAANDQTAVGVMTQQGFGGFTQGTGANKPQEKPDSLGVDRHSTYQQ